MFSHTQRSQPRSYYYKMQLSVEEEEDHPKRFAL